MSNITSNVIPFKKRFADPMGTDIDLVTAVDAAIRDLRDIAQASEGRLREQADECRQMLEQAFAAAVGDA
jgi:hypothetical protein